MSPNIHTEYVYYVEAEEVPAADLARLFERLRERPEVIRWTLHHCLACAGDESDTHWAERR